MSHAPDHAPLRATLALGLAAAALVSLGAGCTTDTTDPDAPPPPPAIEFDDWCDPSEAPKWEIVANHGTPTLGPCGHALVNGDVSARLLHPDGREDSFNEQLSSPQFAPTGQLAAWYQFPLDLVLRELGSDETRAIAGTFERFDFARSLYVDVGARLWTCGATLTIREFDEDRDRDHGPALCPTVTPAKHAPLLAYVSDTGALNLVDVDSGDKTQITNGLSTDEAAFDRVGLDHDGRVVVHYDYGVDFNQQWTVQATALYTSEGDYLGELAGNASLHQGSEPGAPVFVHSPSAGLAVVSGGELVMLHEAVADTDEPSGDELDAFVVASGAGDLLVATTDFRVLRYSADAPTSALELASHDSPARTLRLSRSGEWAAWTFTSGCVDEFCDYLWSRTSRWSTQRGYVDSFDTVVESDLYFLFDSGTLLARTLTLPEVDALPPGMTPVRPIRTISADNEILYTLPVDFVDAELVADWLPGDRALLDFTLASFDHQLDVVNGETGGAAAVGPVSEYDSVELDARGMHVLAQRDDGRIYWGNIFAE